MLRSMLLLVGLLLPYVASAQDTKRLINAEDLWKVKRVGAPSTSPDGLWAVVDVAITDVSKNESTSELWLLSTDGKTQKQLTRSGGKNSGPKWSPDGKRLAAYVDTYPASIIVYETKSWKPLAQWCCGQIGAHSEFVVTKDGKLLQLMEGQISSLDLDTISTIKITPITLAALIKLVDAGTINNNAAMADYLTLLRKDAFGNFRTLISYQIESKNGNKGKIWFGEVGGGSQFLH